MNPHRMYLLAAVLVCTAGNLPAQASTDFQRSEIPGQLRKSEPATTSSQTTKAQFISTMKWGCDDEWKLNVNGDIRLRLEQRDNFDMDSSRDDDDGLAFLRTRINFDLTYDDFVRAFVTLFDARQFGIRDINNGGVDPMQEDHADILQAFLEFHRAGSPWKLRAGRQLAESLGEGRLVDNSAWSNLIKSFQGIWLSHKTKEAELHFWFLQELLYQHQRDDEIVMGNLRPKNHEWFYGTYATFKYLAPHEFDLYLMGVSDLDNERTFPSNVTDENGDFGTTDRYTMGTRWRGPVCETASGKLGYGLEAAYQFGHRSNDDIRAHLLHADLNHTWNHPWKPRVALEGNLASGDKKYGDGENNTFSPLYGSNHTPYGIMDFTRLSNLRELVLSASVEPNSKSKIRLELHKFQLDSKTDSWYSGAPGSFPRDKTGKSGRNLGEEFDVVGSYKLNEYTTMEAGAGHFFPGTFAKSNGREDGANFFYVQTLFTF